MEILERLQEWYSFQCDGDWEHYCGISIDNLDNPGWMVTIDLQETEVENKSFQEVKVERSENDWIICRVEDNKFKGDGGPRNLAEVLETFLNWAASKELP